MQVKANKLSPLWNDYLNTPPLDMHSHAVLKVDLAALCRNYDRLRAAAPHSEIAAVVKSNAYGLGMIPVAKSLASHGCRSFFVAYADEGCDLRSAISDDIYIFHGLFQNHELFRKNNLIPVLNTVADVKYWLEYAKDLPVAIQLNTGLNRLGFNASDIASLPDISELDIRLLLSHLSDSPDTVSSYNQKQLMVFNSLRQHFPNCKGSMLASGLGFQKSNAHMDMTRTGKSLYGLLSKEEGYDDVFSIWSRIYQIHELPKGTAIGYAQTYVTNIASRIAVVTMGYADGMDRRLSNQSVLVDVKGQRAPIVGNISMDVCNIDITNIPNIVEGDWVKILHGLSGLLEWQEKSGLYFLNHMLNLSNRCVAVYG